MSQDVKSTVFSKDVIEFVTVSLEYCVSMESFTDKSAEPLITKLTRLLPLLYLKTSLLPETDYLDESAPEIHVTEEHYNYISSRLYEVFAQNDTYLEVFLEDMKYSETPISASISEDLTDIYQDLKNFLHIYEQGITENMNDALHVCFDNFKNYWGQKLVNVLRALHMLAYTTNDDDVDETNLNMEDEW